MTINHGYCDLIQPTITMMSTIHIPSSSSRERNMRKAMKGGLSYRTNSKKKLMGCNCLQFLNNELYWEAAGN
jgi:hypothetical protein